MLKRTVAGCLTFGVGLAGGDLPPDVVPGIEPEATSPAAGETYESSSARDPATGRALNVLFAVLMVASVAAAALL